MVRVQIKFRPRERGLVLPNWFRSEEEIRGTHLAHINIAIPENTRDINAHIRSYLRSHLTALKDLGETTYRPLNNTNENNNLGNLMSAFGAAGIGNSNGKKSKRITRKKIIGFERVFEPESAAASASPAHPGRGRSKTVRRSNSRSRSRNGAAASGMNTNDIREAARANATLRLRKALATTNTTRSRSRATSKKPMKERPTDEQIAIIQSYVKKWYRSLLEKAMPERRKERSRSRLRINGVTISPEQERIWREEQEKVQENIEQQILRRAQAFYRSELKKFGLPNSANTGFLWS